VPGGALHSAPPSGRPPASGARPAWAIRPPRARRPRCARRPLSAPTRKVTSEDGRCEPRAEIGDAIERWPDLRDREADPTDRALNSPTSATRNGRQGRRAARWPGAQLDSLGDGNGARGAPPLPHLRARSGRRFRTRPCAPVRTPWRPLAKRPPLPFPPPLA